MKQAFQVAFTGFLFYFLTSFHSPFFSTSPDAIIGNWWNQEKEAQIQIYKIGNTYAGKIVWLKEPNDPQMGKPKLDIKNPDKNLRNRSIMGMELMYGFSYDPDETEWSGGKIYDGRSGKTYKSYLALQPNGTLKVRGYVAAAWMGLGETNIWTRVNP